MSETYFIAGRVSVLSGTLDTPGTEATGCWHCNCARLSLIDFGCYSGYGLVSGLRGSGLAERPAVYLTGMKCALKSMYLGARRRRMCMYL